MIENIATFVTADMKENDVGLRLVFSFIGKVPTVSEFHC